MTFDQSTHKIERGFLIGVIIILLTLLVLFGVQSCIKSKNITKLQDTLATNTYNSKMAFDSVRNKNGELITTQEQLKASKNAEIVKHIEKEENLLKLASNVQIKTVYQIKEVLVPYKDTVKILTVKDSISGITEEYLKTPSRVVTVDSNFLLDATVLSKGLEINYLQIPNTTTVSIGEQGSIFKHKSVVRVKNSNPYILQTDQKNIVVVDPKQKNKPLKTFAIGAGIGISVGAIASGLLYFYTHK